MFKKLSTIVFCITAVVALAACSSPAAATAAPAATEVAAAKDEWGEIIIPAGKEVKLGLSSALSGGYAVYGQDMLNGVNIAIDTFGKLKGFNVVAVGGDDQCEGAPGVTVAEQFSADPQVIGVVGPMCSGTVVAASDIYNAHKVIMITPSSTAVVVTARGYPSVFRVVANDELQSKVTNDFLVNDLKVKSLALLHDQSVYGQGIAEAVQSKFTATGGKATAIEGITRGETDFSAVISTVLAGNPEAVYWGGMDAEGALIVNQLRKAGFTGVFFGPDGIKSKPSFVDASGGAAEGAYITFGAVGGASGYEDFEAKFKAKYGDPVAYGPGSFDAAMVILKAADAVAKVDKDGNLVIGRKALADAIRATPYNGITGFMQFTDTGDLGVVSITVFQVKSGEIVALKTTEFGK